MELRGARLDFLGHSGFLISAESGKKIIIDPYNISENVPKADFVLITHSHYDHCSIEDIKKVSNVGTVVVVPADSQSKITRIENVEMQVAEVGDELNFGNVKIEIFPSYNINKEFHPKKEGWFGYLIKVNG